MFFFSYVYS